MRAAGCCAADAFSIAGGNIKVEATEGEVDAVTGDGCDGWCDAMEKELGQTWMNTESVVRTRHSQLPLQVWR